MTFKAYINVIIMKGLTRVAFHKVRCKTEVVGTCLATLWQIHLK